MAKLVSLDGIGDVFNSFKESVNPVDVLVGATIRKVIGPTIDKKLDELAFSKVEFFKTQPLLKKVLGAAVMAIAAYMVQKGNKRAAGHVVGILGIDAVEIAGSKLSEMLPANFLGGLVEYQGYGVLTQDNAYGLLTQDNAYGSYQGSYSGEPTAAGMAEFAQLSNMNTEVDPEAEYA